MSLTGKSAFWGVDKYRIVFVARWKDYGVGGWIY